MPENGHESSAQKRFSGDGNSGAAEYTVWKRWAQRFWDLGYILFVFQDFETQPTWLLTNKSAFPAQASVTLPKGGKASIQPSKLCIRTRRHCPSGAPDNVPMAPDGSLSPCHSLLRRVIATTFSTAPVYAANSGLGLRSWSNQASDPLCAANFDLGLRSW